MGKVRAATLLVWAVGVTTAVTVTRNPLYMVLIFASCLAVALALDLPLSDLRWLSWGWLVLGGFSALFNFLTVHSGDLVVAELPPHVPVFGGIYTVNALVYGLQFGMVFSCLSLTFWVFWRGCRMMDFYRMVPRRLHGLGVALTLGLTLFPGLVQAMGHVREAQQVRLAGGGRTLRYYVLIIPTLGLALERSLQLAEAMESRGFGALKKGSLWTALGAAAGASMCFVAIYLSLAVSRLIGYAAFGAGLALLSVSLFTLSDLKRAVGGVLSAGPVETVWLGSAFATVVGFLGAVALGGTSSLNYYPYPSLHMPAFDLWVGILSVLPSAPAVAQLLGRDRVR